MIWITALSLWAASLPLFYHTCHYDEEDMLNVRAKPDFHAQKVGSLYVNSLIEVFECRDKESSFWCKIRPIEADGTFGWVNAKYIAPLTDQQGYVVISDRKSICDYVLKCRIKNQKEQCLVVTGLGDDMQTISLQTEWIDRRLLRPASNFTAADDLELNPEGDYCTRAYYIMEYLKKNSVPKATVKMK